ncbi:MAG: alpha/beta hydrolase [bacterium]|nr:alpha/beta hydrolase [bacterium]
MTSFLDLPEGVRIAYQKRPGRSPGLIFFGGFHSDMTGMKATALDAHCERTSRAFVRFDYTGHGQSSGKFEEGTIGRWAADAIAVLDEVAEGPQVIVGSSMGGWIMLLAALARPERAAALVGIAAAPDFTEDLIWASLGPDARKEMEERGQWIRPSAYEETPYPIMMRLIEEARDHLLLRGPIPIRCPVRLLHGMRDEDVPWEVSGRIMSLIESQDATLTLIKEGDHRLSEPADIERLCAVVEALCGQVESGGGLSR